MFVLIKFVIFLAHFIDYYFYHGKFSDHHEESLKKVFGRDIVSKTDITITLAEHLLGKLAPEHTYVIDHRVKGKGKCKCGCGVQPNFGSTGIGMCIYTQQNCVKLCSYEGHNV